MGTVVAWAVLAMRCLAIILFTTLTGCAVSGPTDSGGGGYLGGGKADGPGYCDEGEVGFLACVVESCPEEDEECIESTCADARVDITRDCGECIEAHFGDLELSAARCGLGVPPPGPCAESPAVVTCAAEQCPGQTGEELIDCVSASCEAETEGATPECGECLLVSSTPEELTECAREGSPFSCRSEEVAAFVECGALCADLEGEESSRCVAESCHEVILTTGPICVDCIGEHLDAGETLDAATATCGGDAPADDGLRACSREEMAEILACSEADCATLAGDELDECLEAQCADAFDNAELSDSCATCFIYTIEAGESLESTIAACVSSPVE